MKSKLKSKLLFVLVLIFCLALIIVMCLNSLNFALAQNLSQKVTLTLDDAIAAPGETANVDLYIDEGEIGESGVILQYDPTLFAFIMPDKVEGSQIDIQQMENYVMVMINFAAAKNGVSAKLVTLQFTVNEGALENKYHTLKPTNLDMLGGGEPYMISLASGEQALASQVNFGGIFVGTKAQYDSMNKTSLDKTLQTAFEDFVNKEYISANISLKENLYTGSYEISELLFDLKFQPGKDTIWNSNGMLNITSPDPTFASQSIYLNNGNIINRSGSDVDYQEYNYIHTSMWQTFLNAAEQFYGVEKLTMGNILDIIYHIPFGGGSIPDPKPEAPKPDNPKTFLIGGQSIEDLPGIIKNKLGLTDTFNLTDVLNTNIFNKRILESGSSTEYIFSINTDYIIDLAKEIANENKDMFGLTLDIDYQLNFLRSSAIDIIVILSGGDIANVSANFDINMQNSLNGENLLNFPEGRMKAGFSVDFDYQPFEIEYPVEIAQIEFDSEKSFMDSFIAAIPKCEGYADFAAKYPGIAASVVDPTDYNFAYVNYELNNTTRGAAVKVLSHELSREYITDGSGDRLVLTLGGTKSKIQISFMRVSNVIDIFSKIPDIDFIYTADGLHIDKTPLGQYAVTGYGGEIANGELIIPSQFNGKPITSIEMCAFSSANISSVTIPEGITHIERYAFRSTKLTSVTLPNSLEKLGANVFENTGIKELYLGANVKEFEPQRDIAIHIDSNNSHFSMENGLTMSKDKTILYSVDSSLSGKEIVLPGTLKEVREGAFDALSSFSISFTQGELVSSLDNDGKGEFWFYRTNITAIVIPKGVTELPQYFDTMMLEKISFEDGSNLKTIDHLTINHISELILPEGLETINYLDIESKWQGESTVSFPSTLKNVRDINLSNSTNLIMGITDEMVINELSSVFERGISLDWNLSLYIKVPDSVYDLYAKSWLWASEHTLYAENQVQNEMLIIDNVFYHYFGESALITLPETLIGFAENLHDKYMKNDAPFRGILLTGVNAFDVSWLNNCGVTCFADDQETFDIFNKFGNSNIYMYSALKDEMLISNGELISYFGGNKDITIPSDVTSIRDRAFYGNKKIESITISDSVNRIGYAAFANSTLSKLILPQNSSLEWIDLSWIVKTNVTELFIPKNVSTIHNIGSANISFIVDPENPNYYVKNELFIHNESNTVLAVANPNATNFVIPANVKIIDRTAFIGVKHYFSVSFEAGSVLTSFNGEEFVGTGLECIELPISLTELNLSAFDGTRITTLFIPQNVATITGRARRVELVFDPNNKYFVTENNLVMNIDRTAIYAVNIKKDGAVVVIPNTISMLSYGLFSDIWYSYEIIFESGSKVTGIQSGTFEYSSLTNITLPDNLQSIEERAFYNTRLESIELPGSLIYLDISAFENTKIRTLYIPQNVASLSGSAQGIELIFDPNNKNFVIENGLIMDKGRTTIYSVNIKNDDTVVVIPNTIMKLPERLFANINYRFEVTFESGSKITQITNGMFESSALTSIILPISINEIMDRAFSQTKYLTLVDFGDNMSVFISDFAFERSMPTFICKEGSSAMDFAYRHGFAIKTQGRLLITFDDLSTYNGCVLEVTTGNLTKTFKLDATTLNYNIDQIEGGEEYLIVIKTVMGDIVYENRYIAAEGSQQFRIEKLPELKSVSVEVYHGSTPQYDFTVAWFIGGKKVATGKTISGLSGNETLSYSVTLSSSLAIKFRQPEEAIVNDFNKPQVVNLSEYDKTIISGQVIDANGNGVANADVVITQLLIGKYTLSYSAVTDENGRYTLTVSEGELILTVSHEQYFSNSIVSEVKDVIDTIQLKSLIGRKIDLTITASEAVKEGDLNDHSIPITSFANLKFELYNITKGYNISGFRLVYPSIVLEDSALSAGDRIRVTIKDLSGKFVDTVDAVSLNKDLNATASLRMTTNGKAEITLRYYDQSNSYALLIFNKNGERVSIINFNGRMAVTETLHSGEYIIAAVRKEGSAYMYLQVKDLTHTTNLTVKNGIISQHMIDVSEYKLDPPIYDGSNLRLSS